MVSPTGSRTAKIRKLPTKEQAAAIARELERLAEAVAGVVADLDEITDQDAVATP
ncbi:hypothetical protein [uncultured Nocardioides sp.]|uniref:hypothetical protein n=1 Tax=uncultured Nocardioides sp. TaxID=198441 RepID=UPI0026226900|nr:hypothetical protein [uncultured Nocardioides sp.]